MITKNPPWVTGHHQNLHLLSVATPSAAAARSVRVPGQPVTAYIAGDVGSEMPAYIPFRNPHQSPFDWRTATYSEMTFNGPNSSGSHPVTTNAAAS